MNVYIDLGSYKGETIKTFLARHPGDWEVHAFEANPNQPMDYPNTVTKHREAAWVYDGEIEFYVGKRNPAVDGASLLKNKKTGHLNTKHPVKVKCIDFGKWLKSTWRKEDNIVVKMNIEGAEYAILESMLKDGSLECVDILYLDAHWEKIGIPKDVSDELIARVAERTELHEVKEFYE